MKIRLCEVKQLVKLAQGGGMSEPAQKFDPEPERPSRLQSVVSLVIQIGVAVVLFLAIGLAAVLLNLATDFCEARQLAPDWAVWGMRALEVLLWMVDVVCCVLFVLREAFDFCRTVIGKGK